MPKGLQKKSGVQNLNEKDHADEEKYWNRVDRIWDNTSGVRIAAEF